jgi:hypothetical protein
LRDAAGERLRDRPRLDALKQPEQHRIGRVHIKALRRKAREAGMRTIDEPRQIRRIDAFGTQSLADDFPLLRLPHVRRMPCTSSRHTKRGGKRGFEAPYLWVMVVAA